MEERALVISWQQRIHEEWVYDAILVHREDAYGTIYDVEGISKREEFSKKSYNTYESRLTAEEMMYNNHEQLLREGWLPENRTLLFSTTMYRHNGELLSQGIFGSGVFRYNDILNGLVWGHSNHSMGATPENAGFFMTRVGITEGMARQAFDDAKSIISLLISTHPTSPITYKETLPAALETVGALYRGELSLVELAKGIGQELFDEYYGAFEHVINNYARMLKGEATYEQSVEYGRQMFRVSEVLLLAYGTVKVAARIGTKTSGAIQNAVRKSDDFVPGTGNVLSTQGRVTVDALRSNPNAFRGKSADEVAQMLRSSGYDVSVAASTRSSSGAQIIRVNNPGDGRNITQVQVSPGGGRHGNNPYVKISTSDQGIIKVVDGSPSSYITDGAEKATIIFTGGK